MTAVQVGAGRREAGPLRRLFSAFLFVVACGDPVASLAGSPEAGVAGRTEAAPPLSEGQAVAVFAGGCFWCMEKPFDKVSGVVSTLSGYTGGQLEGPTYREVSGHKTEHIEALRVVYDPSVVTYERLLEVYWHNVDPTQSDGQFCDRGHQYTTAVFVENKAERKAAEKSKRAAQETLGAPVVTVIRDAATFWVAEDYHQDYYRKNPAHYSRYRLGCGRDARLKALWGDAAGH